ncbi:hypothetical protein PAPHI01_1005 [Pancytospora philotis]|nr:hypothetical protein PAPHI01_1005 [Pancytospora philotis]
MPEADDNTPEAGNRSPNAGRGSPSAGRGSPNADKRTPAAESRVPKADNRASSAGEESELSKVPFVCGVLCMLAIVLLLLVTEWLTDASVMLMPVRLVLLGIAIVPFICMPFRKRAVLDILSVLALVCVLVLCCSLYYDRNRVLRFYTPNSSLTPAEEQSILDALQRSAVILLSGEIAQLPDSLAQYNELSPDFMLKLSDRLKPNELPSATIDAADVSYQQVTSIRFSGIMSRVVLRVPAALITGDNYTEAGYASI